MTIKLRAIDYVLATNLYNTVTQSSKSKQISFRIGINKNINYPTNNIAFVMSNSEFNIT